MRPLDKRSSARSLVIPIRGFPLDLATTLAPAERNTLSNPSRVCRHARVFILGRAAASDPRPYYEALLFMDPGVSHSRRLYGQHRHQQGSTAWAGCEIRSSRIRVGCHHFDHPTQVPWGNRWESIVDFAHLARSWA